jgi:hypothetical protein
MKYILFSLIVLSASAQEIKGTLMLEGSLRSELMVKAVKSTCKVKVEKVKNLREEDDFGNPGYTVRFEIDLRGSDFENRASVKKSLNVNLTNMHLENGKKIVKDLLYVAPTEKVEVQINEEGRLKRVSFPYSSEIVTCIF